MKRSKEICIILTVFIYFAVTGCATFSPGKGNNENKIKSQDSEKTTVEQKIISEEKAPPLSENITEQVTLAQSDELAREKTSSENMIQKKEKKPLLVKESVYFPNGLLDTYTLYFYNRDTGNLVREEQYAADGTIFEKVTYKYENGTLVEKTIWGVDNKIKLQHCYTYDRNGQMISDVIYDESGKIQTISRYENDEKGNRLKWSVFDGSGSLHAFTTYHYEGGLIFSIKIFSLSKKLESYSIIEYDENKIKTKESFFSSNGSLLRYIQYHYSDNLLVEEKRFDSQGSLTSKLLYQYDEYGNIIKLSYIGREGNIIEIVEREYRFLE